jgi:glycogen(starch) synthase
MLSWEFPPRIIGGIARHVAELSSALARAGHFVDVVTAHHPGAPEEEVIPTPEGGLRVLRAGPAPVNPLDFVCEIHQLDFGLLERVLRDRGRGGDAGMGTPALQYDLIHAHDWLVAFAARTLRRGTGTPLVATMHATEWGRNGGVSTPMQHYIHSVEWLLTYDACRVICCSQAMAGEVEGALQAPADKVRVIPNGVDPERLRCTDSPAELAGFRRRWARDEERIVLFVGRLVREKGVEVLIDAMPEVLAAHPEAKLVVAGGGWWGNLAAQASARGIGRKVAFAGFVPDADLPRLYAVADVAVFPSLYEPFGIVALEAMAAGVPVVTSDIGGFREVVRHGETGVQTWANNPHSLAWGINLALGDVQLAARLRRRAGREVRQRFAWDGIATATLEVYDEVLRMAEKGERGEVERAAAIPFSGPGIRPRYVAMSDAPRSREWRGERGETMEGRS